MFRPYKTWILTPVIFCAVCILTLRLRHRLAHIRSRLPYSCCACLSSQHQWKQLQCLVSSNLGSFMNLCLTSFPGFVIAGIPVYYITQAEDDAKPRVIGESPRLELSPQTSFQYLTESPYSLVPRVGCTPPWSSICSRRLGSRGYRWRRRSRDVTNAQNDGSMRYASKPFRLVSSTVLHSYLSQHNAMHMRNHFGEMGIVGIAAVCCRGTGRPG